MQYLQKYEDFLIKNASQITSIESSLRSLTYILPGRFHDAEFASQAVYAAINLVSLYHNSILRRAAKAYADETRSEVAEESTFNKYINFWSSKSHTYKHVSTLLSVIAYTQVLMEMGVAKKWGKRTQWRWVATLEALKVILRLMLFKSSGQRMTLYPTHLERDVDPATLAADAENVSVPRWTGRRTGIEIPRMDSTIEFNPMKKSKDSRKFDDINDYLMSKVLTPEKLQKPGQMVHTMHKLGGLGEILYILRPLVYVLAIMRYGKRSWKPWWVSLLVELASQAALRKEFDQGPGRRSNMKPLEKQELSRRAHLLWFNLLRGAFYTNITRPRLERFCNRVEDKALISIVGNVIRTYLPLWENVYFYTSSS
ncbi:peroxisome membrane protein [Radiomyces spectabilis]|uniref:peroxisome membrane protein n=1 Tax=Radiomyces spectabilis TaxID=64574 RepID=UPI00221ECBB7|nr:peroxisome membrane protein [Radiomyces spectabilis]KAI8381352.1 peroxisome membrane protein [Radiomyces spectabilis]